MRECNSQDVRLKNKGGGVGEAENHQRQVHATGSAAVRNKTQP